MKLTGSSLKTRTSTTAALLIGLSLPADAQLTNVQVIALNGGRVIGAAAACRLDNDRVKGVGVQLLTAISERSRSRTERERATEIYIDASALGASQVRAGRVPCRDARAALNELEKQLK